MNLLKRLHKEVNLTSIMEFKYVVYLSLLSDVVQISTDEDLRKIAAWNGSYEEFLELFPEWDNLQDDSEIVCALSTLESDGLISFNEDGTEIYVGTMLGKKFIPFTKRVSFYEQSVKKIKKALKEYCKGSSAKGVSRGQYLTSVLEGKYFMGTGSLKPNDFTELHGYLYELYTGGEVYIIRKKLEYYQTTNMLKAYDKDTVFSILVEGVLNFDFYRQSSVPNLVNIACMKDDIYRSLIGKNGKGKEYMRETESTSGGF